MRWVRRFLAWLNDPTGEVREYQAWWNSLTPEQKIEQDRALAEAKLWDHDGYDR